MARRARRRRRSSRAASAPPGPGRSRLPCRRGEATRPGNTAAKADRSPKPDRRRCEPRWSARRIAPQTRHQLAKIYYTQLVDCGAEHRKAQCMVAGHLARLGGRDPARTAADRRGDLVTSSSHARQHARPERRDQAGVGHRGLSASGRASRGEQGASTSSAINRSRPKEILRVGSGVDLYVRGIVMCGHRCMWDGGQRRCRVLVRVRSATVNTATAEGFEIMVATAHAAATYAAMWHPGMRWSPTTPASGTI
jgi:hypothetical protein